MNTSSPDQSSVLEQSSKFTHTPGTWVWWTSCSWRRLRSELDHGKTVDVLMPCVQRDGHPDIIVSDDDMVLIAAAKDMLAEHQENARILGFLVNELQGLIPAGKMSALYLCLERCNLAIAKATGRPA